jgi:hypothetical protein
MARRLWLTCGVLAAVVYAVVDASLSTAFGDYSYISQTVSELSAIGSFTRDFAVPLFLAHSVLQLLFGWGVWRVAADSPGLRQAGVLLAAIGVLDLMAPMAPMHARGAEPSFTDVLHIALTMVTALLIVLAMWTARTVRGRAFRIYSLFSIAAVLGFGSWTGMFASRIAADLPTPWVGVIERACIYSYMAWMAVLSIVLALSPPGNQWRARPEMPRKAA